MIITIFKKILKLIPFVWYMIIKVRNTLLILKKIFKLLGKNEKKIFTKFYQTNKWGNIESFSGDGSTKIATKPTRNIINDVIKRYKIKCMLDIPCGDFNWMKLLNLSKCKYFGSDIVDEIIQENKKFETNNIYFFQSNIIKDKIKKYDLIFSRDCLVHLHNNDVKKALRNIISSKSIFLLTTTFPMCNKNKWIINGMWRPINLEISPFLFPKPIEIFLESKDSQNRISRDKYLGLWEIKKLKSVLKSYSP